MNETKLPGAWKLVPVPATTEMVVAIEAAIDAQLTASGMAPRDMHRQDGDAIYAAAMAAAPVAVPGTQDIAGAVQIPIVPLEQLINVAGYLTRTQTAKCDPAQVQQAAPSGWKLVPVEPTDDMIVAFAEVWYSKVRCIDDCEMDDCYTAMLAAAPSAPAWSSATAPGPDGMQHCVAVPGMPSAARDAELEDAASYLDTKRLWTDATGQAVREIRALKSIAGPVAGEADAVEVDMAWRLRQRASGHMPNQDDAKLMLAAADECDRFYNGMLAWKKTAQKKDATPAPVQQAAPSGIDYLLRSRVADLLHLTQFYPNVSESDERAAARARSDIQAMLAAAPAQPVGLSEQDKLDAARYHWLCKQFGQTQLPCLIERVEPDYGYVADGKESIDKAIDAAILAAKEAP